MNGRILIPVIVILAAVVIAAFVLTGPAPAPAKEPLTLVIIATSDLQSQIEPYWNDTGSYVGGFGRISGMQKKLRSGADAALLISSGDDLIGTFYDSFSGQPEMESMTAAGYDVVCPGNHEFDFGEEKYRNATSFSGFPIVCSNMKTDDPSLDTRLRSSVMLDVSGVNVGVFGLMTPDLVRISSPGEGISVDPDVIGISVKMVEELRSKGADLVIAVTHTGVDTDREIARSVAGIDLIVGGHDPQYVYETVQGPAGWETIIIQEGMRGERLGVLRFTYSGDGISDPEWSGVWLDNSTPTDPEIEEIITPYLGSYREKLKQTIGVSLTALDTRKSTVRTGEAAAGNLITDAWREWFSHNGIVFVNGDGIRGDTVIAPGNITYLLLYQMLPYRDEIVSIPMTGKDIRQALECSASALGPDSTGIDSGGFLQVSGLHYTIDMNGAPYAAEYNGSTLVTLKNYGSRVINATIETEDGSYIPLRDDAVYNVLVNAWLAGGGDGYWIFSGQENKTYTTVYDINPVAEFIRRESPVAPVEEGRIVVMNGTGGIP